MNDIQGVLFDLDGTLIDTYDIILCSMRYTINETLGKQCSDDELMRGVGTPLYDQMLHFAEGDEAKATELLQLYRDHNDGVHDVRVHAFADTHAALERLRKMGMSLGVVTSKRHELAARGLQISGLADFFEVLIAPDDWPEHKPHPGPVLHGCDLLGLAPERCLYVGDSPYDIQAGNAAGCATVAALWGMFSQVALAEQHPTVECASLTQLVELLEKER